MVGVNGGHDGVWLHVPGQNRAQADGRRRAARHRLADDMAGRQLGQLLARQIDVVRVGDDQDALRRDKRRQPPEGFLQHGPLTGEVEELLRKGLPAARPKAGAAAAGQDDNDEAIVRAHGG